MLGPERPYDRFDNISALDFRYPDKEVSKFASERAFVKYQLDVEVGLAAALAYAGICSNGIADEIAEACEVVDVVEVYEEESRVGHNVRALVNCIQRRITPQARPFVHLAATSYDTLDTASSKRYQNLTSSVATPALLDLEKELITISLREAESLQIGRTHGQHAVPITFGFAMASFVDRLGDSISNLQRLNDKLVGQFSGATGSYNASSLLFEDPEGFEREVLSLTGLETARISTQIIPPEPNVRLFSEYVIATGIMANLSDDMRNLQRTEIGEVGEEFGINQVGSSTMPQKRNPINFENGKSMWKIVMPRLMTVFMDQISDHQRDLTNSASSRTYIEMMAYTISVAKRLTRTMRKLRVDPENLQKNLRMQGDLVGAEACYILLASKGHPDAHEYTRLLTLKSQGLGSSLTELLLQDEEVKQYTDQFDIRQLEILKDPSRYTGIAAKKAISVANYWKERLNI